jgi:hypothetical protein
VTDTPTDTIDDRARIILDDELPPVHPIQAAVIGSAAATVTTVLVGVAELLTMASWTVRLAAAFLRRRR